MGEWILAFFGNSIAQLTFFSIFAAGLTITLFQLVFGGDADHDIHSDVGGDHGDFHADHDAHGSAQGPGLFSVRGGVYLVTGFGGVSFITMYMTEKVLVSSIVGLTAAFPFALGLLALYRMFLAQQASSMVQSRDFHGISGTVVTSIPAQGMGEVTLIVRGKQITKSATSATGMALKSGTPVQVRTYLGDRVTVAPYEQTVQPKSSGATS